MPRWTRTVPNVGHDLGGGAQAIETIGAFARYLAGQQPFPRIATEIRKSGSRFVGRATVLGMPASRVTLWAAAARTTDFRDSTWVRLGDATQSKRNSKEYIVTHDWVGEPMKLATMLELRFEVKGQGFSLTSPVAIFR
jgi:PhoPQ-activated pathogenicity-related protein